MPRESTRAAGREYRAIVERYDTRPNQCTIFSSDGSDTTTWVSAREGSFVSLALMQ